jgi:seryl-tRNA synthetase
MRDLRKAIEGKAEVVALQKAAQDAAAAHKAKVEELIKADASLAELQKTVDAARAAEGDANAKLIQVRLAGNADVAAIKAKIAELEAAIAAAAPAKKPAEPKKDKPKEGTQK